MFLPEEWIVSSFHLGNERSLSRSTRETMVIIKSFQNILTLYRNFCSPHDTMIIELLIRDQNRLFTP